MKENQRREERTRDMVDAAIAALRERGVPISTEMRHKAIEHETDLVSTFNGLSRRRQKVFGTRDINRRTPKLKL